MKIVADKVPINVDYLTAGKQYDYEPEDDKGGHIVADNGEHLYVALPPRPSAHLDNACWQIIEEDELCELL